MNIVIIYILNMFQYIGRGILYVILDMAFINTPKYQRKDIIQKFLDSPYLIMQELIKNKTNNDYF